MFFSKIYESILQTTNLDSELIFSNLDFTTFKEVH